MTRALAEFMAAALSAAGHMAPPDDFYSKRNRKPRPKKPQNKTAIAQRKARKINRRNRK